ncbi:MAG: chromosome segregation protein SMC, partial [Clostridia bacterium]|nr:chromosome segregation protein SMC [Clostridia bacterium]
MRLTKLEINGFKSFARKTEIDFDKGITAIIGPNGSGKSNIADAVRWVLGEQSAKALRGSKMEDVIFNGTEQRKPQAYCEVALTFDNSDGKLPVDFTEVSVMRRVYRSGESEYFINRTLCRLRDIHELFRDTGIGKEGYSIIGQGRVEEILSNKSNDRRAAFEEAAGVMKYRVRKEEAERKLDNTQKNLLRLEDILAELENQVGPLEEQSAAAREYLKLREELKEIELNVFLYQYDKSQERIKNLTATLEQLSGELESATAMDVELAGSCAAEEEHERALGTTLSELQNRLISLSSGVEARSGEAKLAEERIANLMRERERIEQSNRENLEAKQALQENAQKLAEEAAAAQAALSAQQESLAAQEQELAECDAKVEAQEELLEQHKASMMEAMNRLSDARSQLSRFDAIKTTLEERMQQLAVREEGVTEEAEAFMKEYQEALEQLAAEQSAADAIKAEKQEANAEREARVVKLHELEQEILSTERDLQAKRSRLKVLEEMKRAHEGYYSSVRNVLRDCGRDPSLKKCVEGVVAELISVPAEYEAALEMTLGSALQNIVTPTEEDAKLVIEHLRRHNYGRATLLPVSAMRPRVLNENERGCLAMEGCLGVASELIGYDPRYQGVVENLLGRTVIVKDLDAGIAMNRRYRSQFRIATLKGDIINPGGSMTGGSVQKREFSLLGREREMQDLEKAVLAVEKALAAKQADAAAANAAVEESKSRLAELEDALHAQDIRIAQHKDKEELIRRDIEKNKQDMERLQLERSQIEDNIRDLEEQRREMENVQAGLTEGNHSTQEDIREAQKVLYALREEREKAAEVNTEARMKLVALEKEHASFLREAERIHIEQESLEKRMQRDEAELEQGAAAIEILRQELLQLGDKISVERKDVDELNEEVRKVEEERQEHIRALDELRARREFASAQLGDLRERKHRSEISLNKSQMELANMQDRIWQDYELTYENVLPLRKPIAITAANQRVDELKRGIRALGDVNVSAIEDYKTIKERYDSLKEQCEDLTKAREDLTTLIEELMHTMEKEFREQFTLIQQNFSSVFQELFGGGRAELMLSDPKDILNCDIDIIAQPPGKKLQLLSLLSGGERALTAIALLFAILKLKPTAFCVLDEIESSLDEANVSNFAGYLKDYADDTQFIIITHRRGSMEVCDALYGVAMEEKGVSKVVSAR